MSFLFRFLVLCVLLELLGHVWGDIHFNRTEHRQLAQKKKGKQGTQFDKLPFPEGSCPPGMQPDGSGASTVAGVGCVGLQTQEVFAAMNWLAFPAGAGSDGKANAAQQRNHATCARSIQVQGFTVCEDKLLYDTSFTPVATSIERQGLGEGFPDYVANTLDSPACTVWSIVATQFCDDFGSLEFEKEMATRGCVVELFQYIMYLDGKHCNPKAQPDIVATSSFWNDPMYGGRLHVHRIIVWEKRCYACVYKKVLDLLSSMAARQLQQGGAQKKGLKPVLVDVLKIQSRFNHAGTATSKSDNSHLSGHDLYADIYDGIQYVILSDLFLYTPSFLQDHVGQLLITFPFTASSLTDGLGREAENGYNMWAVARMLQRGAFTPLASSVKSLYGNGGDGEVRPGEKPHALSPVLFLDQLSSVGIDANKHHFFSHTFMNLYEKGGEGESEVVGKGARPTTLARQQNELPEFTLPAYCVVPEWGEGGKSSGRTAKVELQQFIATTGRSRCHPERLWLKCDISRTYDPLLPCPVQLYDALAFDYAVSQGWCNFLSKDSGVEPLRTVSHVLYSDLNGPAIAHLNTSRIGIPARNLEHNKAPNLRLVFFFTVYADEAFVVRLLARLYSPHHFYLLHIDPKGSTPEFERNLRALIADKVYGAGAHRGETSTRSQRRRQGQLDLIGNVALANDVPIVYGASTASILLSRAMAWCIRSDKQIADAIESTLRVRLGQPKRNPRDKPSWDYFVPLTGSDYPLVSLQTMIDILSASYSTEMVEDDSASIAEEQKTGVSSWLAFASEKPKAKLVEAGYQPFLMAWDRGSSEHIKALQVKYPEKFQQDEEVRLSLEITWTERGDKGAIGSNLMETRAFSYGPPLHCNGAHTYYRLDQRNARNDSQWLFPRAGNLRERSRVVTKLAKNYIPETVWPLHLDPKRKSRNFNVLRATSYSNVDAQHRAWRKSDPGTSAAYDRRSVDYIIDSEEGRKYYHFFKHMLLGSEEHYYITMLYNWDRTRKFVTSLSSQAVWNTWKFGSWEAGMGGFKTHTHFLTLANMPLLKGLSKRGVFFGRKLSQKKTPEVIDALDEFIDDPAGLQGRYWPGYFPV